MIGAATNTERGRSWRGVRHSPASAATYSKLQSAPKVILENTLTLKRVRGGMTTDRGWYSFNDPRHMCSHGLKINNATINRKARVETLVTHFPKRRPKAATPIVTKITATETRASVGLLDAIQAASGRAYDAKLTVTKPAIPT